MSNLGNSIGSSVEDSIECIIVSSIWNNIA